MKFAVSFLAALVVAIPAAQATYSVEPIGEPGAYSGCLAVDGETQLGFVGVGHSIGLIAHSELLRLRKGDAVDGTWSVDGGKSYKLDASTDTANTISASVPPTKAMYDLLVQGSTFNVTMGATDVEWSLAGSGKALTDLGACMDKNVKQ